MIPKPTNYKNVKTYIPTTPRCCIFEDCNCNGRLENAHVFNKCDKGFSDYYKAKEWVCSIHHRDNKLGIDGQDSERSDELRKTHQERIERIWIDEGSTAEQARHRWTKIELIQNYRGDEIG